MANPQGRNTTKVMLGAYVDRDLHEAVGKLAVAEDRSIAFIVRRALEREVGAQQEEAAA